MNPFLVWVLLLLVFVIVWTLKSRKRKRREERTLDFSKCYHNQPHAYIDAGEEDIYCCDICGRPYDDVLHKVK